MWINELAKASGVSVRTLHYYDEIGLLKPVETLENGYRRYDADSVTRLKQILLYRELGFPLAKIRELLEENTQSRETLLRKQQSLLLLMADRYEKLASHIDSLLKGEESMSFEAFDMTEIEKAKKEYSEEVEQRWGHTDAYKESAKRSAKYTPEDWKRISEEQGRNDRALVALMGKDPSDPEVQKLVDERRGIITKYFYNCTPEIFEGLGQMFSCDDRFRKNLDKNAPGYTDFLSAAIKIYSENFKK